MTIYEDFLLNYWSFKQVGKTFFEDNSLDYRILSPVFAATFKLNVYKLREPLTVCKAIYDDANEKTRPFVLTRIVR